MRFFLGIFLFLIFNYEGYAATNEIQSPMKVVNSFLDSYVNMKFDRALLYTQMREKRLLKQIADLYKTSLAMRSQIYAKVKEIKSYSLLKEEIFGDLALVFVVFDIEKIRSVKNRPRMGKWPKRVKVKKRLYKKYLLKLYGNRWKIVSSRDSNRLLR